MNKGKTKTILKSILFIICYILIFKGLAIILQKIMNSSGVGVRLIHYAIIVTLLLVFIIVTKKEHILKIDIKKIIKAFKVGGIPLIIYILFFIFVINDFDSSLGYNSPLYIIGWILIYLIGAGFVEELVARGILIDILKKHYKLNSKKNIIMCCIISAILFGLTHLINYFSNGYIPIGQILQTIGMGLYLSSVYVRSKSIYGVALIHGIWDIFSSLDSILFISNNTEITIPSIQSQILLGIFFMIPGIIIFKILTRKNKIEECYENSEI